MRHPGESDLALFAGGDLGLLDRWRVGRHVSACSACREDVDALKAGALELREESSELPDGLNWDRMAREMTANIHVGLEAGECVGPVREKTVSGNGLGWRAAAVMACMSVLLLAAWILNPPERRPTMRGRSIEIRNTATGLELNENGGALVLLHGRGLRAQKPIIVSAPGNLRARFVDEDTGQITINHVYAE